jgi:hypothetical protein
VSTRLPFRVWQLEAEPVATAAAYGVVRAPTERCDCVWCRNFKRWRGDGIPVDVVQVLRHCGLDPARESDVYQQALRPEDGSVLYRWFYFFRGSIASGPQAWRLVEYDPDPVLAVTRWELELLDLPGPFQQSLGFCDNPARIAAEFNNVPEPLRTGPTVQVELRAWVPWTVGERFPDGL